MLTIKACFIIFYGWKISVKDRGQGQGQNHRPVRLKWNKNVLTQMSWCPLVLLNWPSGLYRNGGVYINQITLQKKCYSKNTDIGDDLTSCKTHHGAMALSRSAETTGIACILWPLQPISALSFCMHSPIDVLQCGFCSRLLLSLNDLCYWSRHLCLQCPIAFLEAWTKGAWSI